MDEGKINSTIQLIQRFPFCFGRLITREDAIYYLKAETEQSWAWWLNHIGTFVVFIIGFFGNFLSLLILCRRRLRRNSYTQYLIALAIVDTGAIICEVLQALDELYKSHRKDRRNLFEHTNYSCKFYYYTRFVFYSMSSWVIVALAIERLVAVKFPLWSKHICSVVNARRILFFVLCFALTSQSYHLFMKGCDPLPSSPSNSTCRCKTLPNYASIDTYLTIYLWRLNLMTLLPLTVIITVNTLILSKLFNENSLVDQRNVSDNARRKTLLLYKISRMLVIVSTVYLLLHVPGSSLDIIKFIYGSVLRVCNMQWYYYIKLTHQIFDLLTNVNYGINFYLYVISGKHIRNELLRAFRRFSDRSSWKNPHGNFQRSSYMMSSYVHIATKSPQLVHHSVVPLSKRPTGTSM